jgi:crooked neck
MHTPLQRNIASLKIAEYVYREKSLFYKLLSPRQRHHHLRAAVLDWPSLLPAMSSEARAPRIKNRAPAPVQVSAEQILREAQERQEAPVRQVKQRVEDLEELEEYRNRKRTEYESRVRGGRHNINNWLQYAGWEAQQGELARSRSVFERALDIDFQHIQLWMRYIDMELKNRNVQHARNLLDRAVTILPRQDSLWFKYVHLEELLDNVGGTRQVFERWMAWEPEEKAWDAYIGLEVRYKELERASGIWARKINIHSEPKQFIRWAKFEEDRGAIDAARTVFAQAMEFFGEEEDRMEYAQTVYTAFAKMETRMREYDRARVIYKYALERLPRSKSAGVFASYNRFEKQYGTRQGIEDTVLGKRRIQYEEELNGSAEAKLAYDTWFDYTRLEEDAFRTLQSVGAAQESKEYQGALARVRDIYERAIANVPPSQEKRHWRRYVFLWLNYALFEEIDVGDFARTREVYKAALSVTPHKQFTFAKLWLNYAHFEVRRLELQAARKVLGAAIGMCAKDKIFRGYVDLELSLKEFDRARKLYERALEWDASNSRTWIRFAELERNLFDISRARALYELAIQQSSETGGLDMPEVIWKAYIDFEFDEREWQRVEQLYERLLERTGHVKVWISYAQSFMAAAIATEEDEDENDEEEGEEEDAVEQAAKEKTEDQIRNRLERRDEARKRTRDVYERAYKSLKERGLKEERVVVLEAWKAFEAEHGQSADALQRGAPNEELRKVEARMPRVVKKRRAVEGSMAMEEYYDLLFPDDEDAQTKPSFALLQAAHAWRQKQQQQKQEQEQSKADHNGSKGAAEQEERVESSTHAESDGRPDASDDEVRAADDKEGEGEANEQMAVSDDDM